MVNTRFQDDRRPSMVKNPKAKRAKKAKPATTSTGAAVAKPQLVLPSPAPAKVQPVNPYAKIPSVAAAEKTQPHATAAAVLPVATTTAAAYALDRICRDCGMEINFEDLHVCHAVAGAKVAAPPSDPQEATNNEDVLKAINKAILEEECRKEDYKYIEATVHTKHHENRRQTMLTKLINVIQANGSVFGTSSHMEKDDNGVFVPKLFRQLSGENPGIDKIRVCSSLLWMVAKSLRNEKAKPGECPFLQPSTQNTYMKTLLGVMKTEYNWNFSITHDFNFTGGYFARAKALYEERAEDWPGYGCGGGVPQPPIESVKDLKLSLHLNEGIITEHQQKSMMVCGNFFGLRGRNEHAYLNRSNIVEGSFEPGSDFYGYNYIGITDLTDKSHKIDPINDIARNTKNMMRLPIIDMDDLDDPGSILKRYVDKMHPTQTRLYCKAATKTQKENFALLGETLHMSPNQPIGVNKVAKMIKEAGEKTGLYTTGHGFRRLFITTLVNAPGVSTEEVLGSARHRSVAASRRYQNRNHTSESNKFAALGIKKKTGDSAK